MGCSEWCSKICTRRIRQFLAAGMASHGALVIGTVIGWTAGTFKTLVEDFNDISFAQLWTVLLIGALISLVPAGYAVDRFGRRLTTMFLAIPILLGWICILCANSSSLIYLGRFLSGLSAGGCSVVVPLYIAEVTEDKFRGMTGAMFHQQIIGGSLIGLISGHESWMLITAKTFPLPIFMVIGMYFMPESPIFLIQNGKTSEALESLKWLRATKETEPVEREFKEIQQAIGDGAKSSLLQPKSLLTSAVIKPLCVCMIFMMFHVMSGVGVFTLFTMAFTTPVTSVSNNSSNYLFGIRSMYLTQGPGLQLQPHVLGIILSAVSLVSMGIFSHLTTILKRRPILIYASMWMSFSLIILGVLSYLQSIRVGIDESVMYWLKFVGLLSLFVSSSFSLAPTPWMLMGELLPMRARGIGAVFVAGTFWITTFIFTFLISIFIYLLGIHFVFWFFAGVCASAAFYGFHSMPETGVKSFAELQEHYTNSARHNNHTIQMS